jgi:CelD/BcsL family acetyltransferase involved in cellulose biosynthesis
VLANTTIFDAARRAEIRAPGRAEADASAIRFEMRAGFDFLSQEYRDLFQAADATAFQHPIWLDLVYSRLVVARGLDPAILVGRAEQDGRLVAVLPLVKRRFGPLLWFDGADLGVGDYSAIVLDRRIAGAPGNSGWRQLAQALRRFGVFRIRNVRQDDVGLASATAVFRSSLMGFHAHEVDLTGSFQSWRATTLRPEFARFLQKKRRKLMGKGRLSFAELGDPSAIRDALTSMRDFRKQRWPGDLMNEQRFFDFYVNVACAGLASGLSRTYVLSIDNVPVAVPFGLYHAGRFSFVLIGFDFERFRNYSVGLLAIEDLIEDCIAKGDSVFDLTIGDEAYKADFAARRIPMAVVWAGQRPVPALAHLAYASLVRFRSFKNRGFANG